MEKIESKTKGPTTFSNFTGENTTEGKVKNKDKSTSLATPFGMDATSLNYCMAVTISSESEKTESPNWRAKGYRNQGSKNSVNHLHLEGCPGAFNATSENVNKKYHKNQLGIQLYDDGLLRCYGRMIHAEIPDDAIYPILLPKKSYFTSILIKEYHQKPFHSGVSHTLAQLRNEYWILQGRAEVKKAIHDCGICKRYQGGPFKLPSRSPWPRKKVAKCALFTYTVLDYFGPLYI